MFAIDTRSRVPIYEQLEQNFISLIISGVLSPMNSSGVRTLRATWG